jgi:hypothetical protein
MLEYDENVEGEEEEEDEEMIFLAHYICLLLCKNLTRCGKWVSERVKREEY